MKRPYDAPCILSFIKCEDARDLPDAIDSGITWLSGWEVSHEDPTSFLGACIRSVVQSD